MFVAELLASLAVDVDMGRAGRRRDEHTILLATAHALSGEEEGPFAAVHGLGGEEDGLRGEEEGLFAAVDGLDGE